MRGEGAELSIGVKPLPCLADLHFKASRKLKILASLKLDSSVGGSAELSTEVRLLACLAGLHSEANRAP